MKETNGEVVKSREKERCHASIQHLTIVRTFEILKQVQDLKSGLFTSSSSFIMFMWIPKEVEPESEGNRRLRHVCERIGPVCC